MNETNKNPHEVAQEIARQIGRAAFFMMGAQNLISDGSALSFQIRGSRRYNRVRVELNGSDLYDITFTRIRALKISAQDVIEDVYADQLHSVISYHTGLELRFPRVINL